MEKVENLRIPLELIKHATNNFGNENFIAEGGFGKVYKAKFIHYNDCTVGAVKRLNLSKDQATADSFWREIVMLSTYKHINIISLLGFCDESDERIIVYEYASNKSLDFHLLDPNLTWIQRLKICFGAACGLEHLHNPNGTQQRTLHRDIKSANILLDENWNAKIADFGLSKYGPANQEDTLFFSDTKGTLGYCDPVYIDTMLLTKESDVYSFGVVLFEVLCSRTCIDFNYNDERRSLPILVKKCYQEQTLDTIIDVNLRQQIEQKSFDTFVKLAYQCLELEPRRRPSMDMVVAMLEIALNYQIFTDKLKIQLNSIRLATNNFAKDHCIGRGGFGEVYKGKLFHSEKHTLVALKRLNRAFGQGSPEFWKEVHTLSSFRHVNIVNLLGFCNESNEMILVYEYVSNKSLDFSLNNNDLTWVQRLKICIGAARGLAHLHNPGETQQSVWHLDIKSGNILLDENWNAKIADLGLSENGDDKQKITSAIPEAVGTVGYCDPVYIETGIPTKESDVYSFGVVLFEVLGGRLCIDDTYEHPYLIKLAQSSYQYNNLNGVIFGNIEDEINPTSLWMFTTTAYQCLTREREKRPSMEEIVTALETALEYQVPPLPLPTLPHSRSSNVCYLKPLQWEKTPPMVGSLWEMCHKHGIKSRAPEIDIMEVESLFCKHKYRAQPGHEEPKAESVRLVHLDRASNCEIMLRNINIQLTDINETILALDSFALSFDQIYNLIEFCPTKEEMEMLKNYTGDKEKLGLCEQFFLECTKIPRIEPKLRVYAFKVTFSSRIKSFTHALKTIKEASKEIRESAKLVKIMEIILTIGNKLNAGTTRGSARGFKLDSLEKLGDICATDKNITLLHFLCKVVAEQIPELLDFDKDLIHLQAAYWIQTKNLYEEKSTLLNGFEEVEQEFKASTNDGDVYNRFRKELKVFLDSAGDKLRHLTYFFDEVDRYADSVVIYFGEDPSQCSWKQVISYLVRFIERFKKAHDQNKLRAIVRKKKLEEPMHKSVVHITTMKIKRDIAGNTLTTMK